MIRFTGAELKVAKRRGLVNTFLPPFPEDLVPILETYWLCTIIVDGP